MYQPRHPRLQPASDKPKRGKIIVALIVLLVGGFFAWSYFSDKGSETLAPEPVASEQAAEAKVAEEKGVSYTVSEGDIPAEVFAEHGKLDANAMQALLEASAEVYDFTKIKVGRELEFFSDESGRARKIKYFMDTESVIVAEAEDGTFRVRKEDIPYEKKEETLKIRIDEFLYKDALDAGLSEASVLEIADIFSFDIDFTTEIREGDELTVVFEKRTLDGAEAPDGKILAAKFTNVGQGYFAYYFENGNESGHYDPEGHELKRQFLRAPLSYRRITSGYTGARFHPITRTVSAHYQIDYAAPSGTPVVSTARGTVASAGWEGGWGNMVRITHDNGYTTHYGHLSGFGKGIRAGASVSQGQVVGFVGSTGWSTGPHLDYGMKLNGSPVNPMSLKLPKGTPLSGEALENFKKAKAGYESKL